MHLSSACLLPLHFKNGGPGLVFWDFCSTGNAKPIPMWAESTNLRWYAMTVGIIYLPFLENSDKKVSKYGSRLGQESKNLFLKIIFWQILLVNIFCINFN